MASPLSVGDVIALSKLAITLGRAFTKGRRSAPEEFKEVESQLYSLSAALDAITSLVPESAADKDAQDSLSHAIQSCRRTLAHLEMVVTKYGVLKKDDTEKPDGSRFRRWNTGLKTGWKSIMWTTEGGDLAALRSNLTVHMNSLDLLLGVMANTQTGQLKTRVDQLHTVLQDVRSWLVENLPASAPGSRAQTWQTTTTITEDKPTYLYFQLWEWTDKETLICGTASFAFTSHKSRASESVLFTCNCTSGFNTTSPHKTQLEALQRSPLSFSSRIAGSQRVIMFYKISDRNTASMKTLLAKRMSIKGMAAIEEAFLHRFPLQQSKSLLLQNMSTLLCYAEAPNTGGSPRAHILHLIGDPVDAKERVQSVTIERGLMSLKQDSIDTVQLLHYKTVELEKLLDDPKCVPEAVVHYNKTAEVSIFYSAQHHDNQEDDEISRTVLELTPSIGPQHAAGDITVLFDKVDTKSFDHEENEHAMPDVRVTFEFFDPRAAMNFFTKVQNMRMELFILHLQFPRSDEKVLLKVSAKDIHTENLHMTSANIQILKNEAAGKYRLLMVDNTGYCVVSQDLAQDFLSSLSTPGKPPNFRSPTYVVQMDDEGSRKVRQYPKGFAYVAFSEASVERLFKIGLSAVAEANTELLDAPDGV